MIPFGGRTERRRVRIPPKFQGDFAGVERKHMLDELDSRAAALFGALSADPRPAPPLDELAHAAGLDHEDADDALGQLGAAGLAGAWTLDGRTRAALSPLAARRLGLDLRGGRWVDRRRPLPRETLPNRKAWGLGDVGLERVEDPHRIDPRERMEAAESDPLAVELRRRTREAARRASGRYKATDDEKSCRALPVPQHFVGDGVQWRRWGRFKAPAECPACRGGPLPTSVYCLVCDRWGLDWLWSRRTPDVVDRRGRRLGLRGTAAVFRPRGAGREAVV